MEVNDVISRQAAIDAIRGWVNKAFEDWGNAETEIRCFNAIYPLIMALPSAQLTQTNTDSTQGCISRQAAIYAVSELVSSMSVCISVDECDGMKRMQGMAVRALNNLPSAQPEIIRCKDCKWWSNDDYRECSNPNYDDGYVTPAGFYCGWAERRTDG